MPPRFDNLDGDSLKLLKLVVYLAPGKISNRLLEKLHNKEVSDIYDLGFCTDISRFFEALVKLRTNDIIDIDREGISIKIDASVQKRFKSSMSLKDRQDAFNNAAAFLLRVFSKKEDAGVPPHESWEGCKQHLENLNQLRDYYREERRVSENFKASWEFCEMIIRYQLYLFASTNFNRIEAWCTFNLSALHTLEDCPRKHHLKAIMLADLAKLAEIHGSIDHAIELNHRVYDIRLQEQPQKKDLLCDASSNLGYCYNTANQHETALQWLIASRRWWALYAKDFNVPGYCPVSLLNNAARCLIYLDDFEAAKQILDTCIKLVEDEKLKDWNTVAKAYFVLGTLEHRLGKFEAAKERFKKAKTTWLMGEMTYMDPFHAGCFYKIATCCVEQEKFMEAMDNFAESIQITGHHAKSMPMEHARNLFGVSKLLRRDSEDRFSGEADSIEKEANGHFKGRRPDDVLADCDDFVSIIWR